MNIGFIFPGQGSQSIGMGKDFIEHFPIAKQIVEKASDTLHIDMQKLLLVENDEINQTKFTQPAILLVSYMAYYLFNENYHIIPKFALGHSLGEITANLIAGSLSLENALRLVYRRGELMQETCANLEAGMAVVMGLDDEILEKFCQSKENLWCANYNGDGQIVLAGLKSALLKAEDEIKNLGAKRFLILPISVASHCPLLENIVPQFRELLSTSLEDNFKFPIISNATMEAYHSKDKALDLLSMQLTKPVLYKQSIIANEAEIDCMIEFGFGNILKGLNKRLSTKPTYSISNMASLESTLESIK